MIATLANVSQHAESLGFNPDEASEEVDHRRLDPLLPAASCSSASAGSRSRWPGQSAASRRPRSSRRRSRASRSSSSTRATRRVAGRCSTQTASPRPWGTTRRRRRSASRSLAPSATRSSRRAGLALTGAIWGERSDICVPLTNTLFALGAQLGVFAARPGYTDNCTQKFPVAPNGSTSGDEVKSQVAAFRIGDGDVHVRAGRGVPVHLSAGLPRDRTTCRSPSLRCRPGRCRTCTRRTASSTGSARTWPATSSRWATASVCRARTRHGQRLTDRFGCGHSDDSEAASSHTSDIAGQALVGILQKKFGKPEKVVAGPLRAARTASSRGTRWAAPRSSATSTPRSTSPGRRRVWMPGEGSGIPQPGCPSTGRPQGHADRNTRGYFTPAGARVWLDVFPDVPAS